jgi:phosphoglucosamine mutase
MSRLFGTDGVRGIANRDLTPDLALALGRAAARILAPDGGSIVVGRDTRISGPMLEAALVAGICSAGVDVRLTGVVPSPAVAFLTLDERASGGAVISASHNPIDDNGIKFFSREGLKLSGELEKEIEAEMAAPSSDLPEGAAVGGSTSLSDGADRYVAHLLGSIGSPLKGLRVVLDCAHGAAWQIGPRVFREAGAEVVAINAEPDGRRINVDCGSQSLGGLARAVVSEGADLGLAFDGDADRVLAVDEAGAPVDGDRILALLATRMHESGQLKNNLLVATVMANLGFKHALEARGIEVFAAPVGDKFVAEAMADRGAVLGGEQSGHVIFAEHSTTGDGLLTGLQVADAVVSSASTLSHLVDLFETYPQVLINVPVTDRSALDGADQVWARVRAAEDRLGKDGRVLVRASGTESLVRVMVEAADADVAQTTAADLATVIEQYLG